MEQRYVIGLDLGGTDLKAGLVSCRGEIAHFLRLPARACEHADAPFEVIAQAVAELRRVAAGPLAGIGVGCPGVIDPASGALVGRTPHLPHWDSLPLRALLMERLGTRLVVENDANPRWRSIGSAPPGARGSRSRSRSARASAVA
jgi:glucokinase